MTKTKDMKFIIAVLILRSVMVLLESKIKNRTGEL